MSYDINLCDPVSWAVLELDAPHQMRGGTYVMGGTPECHLNVTYNYSKHFYRVFSDHDLGDAGRLGIRTIYGMSGAESIPVLQAAIAQLGTDVSDDYWEPTEGNARSTLVMLLAMAQLRPDCVWQGD